MLCMSWELPLAKLRWFFDFVRMVLMLSLIITNQSLICIMWLVENGCYYIKCKLIQDVVFFYYNTWKVMIWVPVGFCIWGNVVMDSISTSITLYHVLWQRCDVLSKKSCRCRGKTKTLPRGKLTQSSPWSMH